MCIKKLSVFKKISGLDKGLQVQDEWKMGKIMIVSNRMSMLISLISSFWNSLGKQENKANHKMKSEARGK